VRRGARIGLDVALAAAVVGLGAYAIKGPSSPGPAAQPRDTFTRVVVTLDRRGLHVQPAVVPAGQVEVSFADARPRPSDVTVLTTDPATSTFMTGSELVELRRLRTYTLRAFDPGARDPIATAPLRVVVPTLGAPREPANHVTVDVGAGITAPRRDTRFDEPLVASEPSQSPASSVPWTEVAPGNVTVDIRNHAAVALSCASGSVAARVASGGQVRLRIAVPASAGPADQLTCAGGSVHQRLDLWSVA